MPHVQVLTPPTAEQEPVTLALANAALRLDLDVASTDPAIVGQLDYLHLLLAAGREKVEEYTQQRYAPQTLELTFTLGEDYRLPPGAVATSVTGYFTTLEALTNRVSYLSEYYKGVSVNRDLDWLEALQQQYTVTATITPGPVPALVKTAILELTGEWYRNRETTADARGLGELPVSWRIKLAGLVAYPIGSDG